LLSGGTVGFCSSITPFQISQEVGCSCSYSSIYLRKSSQPARAGTHLALSYRGLGDSEISCLASILQGDTSLIRPLHETVASSGSSNIAASGVDRDWSTKNNVAATFSSLDLSGNRISDVGLELIADHLRRSSLRFIALKFNPCRNVPLQTSDGAWTSMRCAASSALETGVESARVSPPRSPGFAAARSCGKLPQQHHNMSFTGAAAGVSSSKLPQKSVPAGRSAKRFKCNVVHPE
jgi:hypothetical protein